MGPFISNRISITPNTAQEGVTEWTYKQGQDTLNVWHTAQSAN